jgi:hypothetical protein
MAPVTVLTGGVGAGGSGTSVWMSGGIRARGIGNTQGGSAPANIYGPGVASEAIAMVLQMPGFAKVYGILARLNKSGSPTDNNYFRVREWLAGGNPPPSSAPVIATSSSLAASTFPTGASVQMWFELPTQPILKKDSWYGFECFRDGAQDSTNRAQWQPVSAGAQIANFGTATLDGSVGEWAPYLDTSDRLGGIVTSSAPNGIYLFAVDTSGSPKLHIYRSLDYGATWAEQDAANAPAVFNSSYPFAVTQDEVGHCFSTVYFTAANTLTVQNFNNATGLWQTAFSPPTTDAANDKPVRITFNGGASAPQSMTVTWSSFTDDADIVTRVFSGGWGTAATLIAGTDTDASTVVDQYQLNQFHATFSHEAELDDFSVKTGSAGTTVAIDSSAADAEAEHISGYFQPWVQSDGLSGLLTAYIDADGTLWVRTATVGVTSASITFGTAVQVSSATTYAGRQVATCKVDGDFYLVVSKGTGIDIFRDAGADGSWGSVVNWKTGLTNCYLCGVDGVDGQGLIIAYGDNGNVKVDWYAPSVTATIISQAISVRGQQVGAHVDDVDTWLRDARVGYYESDAIGWSARSLFAYRTAIQQLASSTGANFGNDLTAEKVAQSFTPVSGISVNVIRVPLFKSGSPTDNVSVQIWSDTGASLPNASIATAANVYSGSSLSASAAWTEFQFSTPVALTSGTKYWIVVQRSGAMDSANYYLVSRATVSGYAGHGQSILVSGVWGTESTSDLTFQILTEAPSALYNVVLDVVTLKLKARKSVDDGVTWTDQDNANAPTVFDPTYPYDACDTRSGPYIGTASGWRCSTCRPTRGEQTSARQKRRWWHGTNDPFELRLTISSLPALRVSNWSILSPVLMRQTFAILAGRPALGQRTHSCCRSPQLALPASLASLWTRLLQGSCMVSFTTS